MISVGDKLPSRIIEMIGSGSSLRLVIWLRHFGCRFYNEASLLLPDLQSRLAMSNIGLICIVQGTKEETELFWNLDGIPVIPDSLKESYRAMEFERTTFRKIFFAEKELKSRRAEVTKMGCAMNSKGTKAKSSDVLQLPGMALINTDNEILWLYRSRHTGDLNLSDKTMEEINKVI